MCFVFADLFQCVDIKNEEILLDDSDSIELNALPAKVPTDKASYHVFTFKHTHEGDYLESKGKTTIQ